MTVAETMPGGTARPIATSLALFLGGVALAGGALATRLVLASDRVDARVVTAVLAVSVGWSFVGCGLIVWRQRPDNRLGRVMVATGFLWFASFLMVAGSPLAFTIGTAVGDVFFVGFVYLLLTFPGGRLTSRLDLLLFAAAVLIAAVVTPLYLLLGSEQVFCVGCPRNVMQVVAADRAAEWLLDAQRLVAACLALLVAVLLAIRWARATPPQRRTASPVIWAGSAMQQRLIAVAMTLGLAEARAQPHPEQVGPLLREARSALALAMDELRDLSQGIHPGVLGERGLDAALDELTRSAALPVTVTGCVGGRLAEAIEGAAYFVASESVANAAKHAHAGAVHLAVSRDGSRLLLRVSDDGIGGTDPTRGSGLRGLVDRVEALGGRMSVSSPPGRGTLIDVELPCE